MTLTFKTSAEHNAGRYTLCEAIEPPGSGAGLHRHATYDETFVICDGHYEFQLDDKMLSLGPGDMVFVPRGMPHSFVSMGPEIGRQLIVSSPGGIFDTMIAEIATAMVDSGSPSSPGDADAHAIEARYGLEFLG